MSIERIPHYLALSAVVAGLGAAAAAQQPAGAPAPSPASDNIVALTPFTVNAGADNNGYRVSNTATGTKIATPLFETPFTIDAINREFLEDANILQVQDATKYIAGVSDAGRNEGDEEAFTIRGFTTHALLRNGIPYNSITDASNIERIEVARGPSALLYGQLDPGGVINYTTKQPFDTLTSDFKFTVGSYEFRRAEYDVKTPLNQGGTLLFRVSGAFTDTDSFQKYERSNTIFTNPVLVWKPFAKTKITFDFTYKKKTGNFSRGGFLPLLGTAGTAYPDTTSVFKIPGMGIDNGTTPPWGSIDDEHSYTEIRVEQSFNEHLSAMAVVGQDILHYNAVSMFVNTSRDPAAANIALPPGNLIDSSVFPFQEFEAHRAQRYELDLVGKFELGPVTSLTLLGVQGYKLNSDIGDVFKWDPLAPFITHPSQPDSVRYAYQTPISQWVPWFTIADNEGYIGPTQWGPPDAYLTEMLSGFQNRLHVLLGVRSQNYPDISKNGHLLPQAGAIYEVAKGLSAYANYSKVDRSNGVSPAGVPHALENTDGYDVGLKFDFPNPQFSGSLTYFHIQRSNVAITNLQITSGGQLVNNDPVLIEGKVRSEGVEADLQYQVTKQLQLVLGYAYTKTKDVQDIPLLQGSSFPGAIPQSYTLYGKYRFAGGALSQLSVGGGVVLNIGPIRFDPPTDNYYTLYQRKSYADINLFAHYPITVFGKTVTLGANVSNLLNNQYMIRSIEVAPPIQVFGSAEIRF